MIQDPLKKEVNRTASQTPLGGAMGYDDGEFGDLESPLDGDNLPKIPGLVGSGTAIVFNNLGSALGAAREAAQVTRGALAELVVEHIGGKTSQPEEQPEADPEKLEEQANEALRVRNFNEPLHRPTPPEPKVARIGDKLMGEEEILEKAGLSSSYKVIKQDGTVGDYLETAVEAEGSTSKKKADREDILATAIGRPQPDLRQASATEGGSALAVTKSAG